MPDLPPTKRNSLHWTANSTTSSGSGQTGSTNIAPHREFAAYLVPRDRGSTVDEDDMKKAEEHVQLWRAALGAISSLLDEQTVSGTSSADADVDNKWRQACYAAGSSFARILVKDTESQLANKSFDSELARELLHTVREETGVSSRIFYWSNRPSTPVQESQTLPAQIRSGTVDNMILWAAGECRSEGSFFNALGSALGSLVFDACHGTTPETAQKVLKQLESRLIGGGKHRGRY